MHYFRHGSAGIFDGHINLEQTNKYVYLRTGCSWIKWLNLIYELLLLLLFSQTFKRYGLFKLLEEIGINNAVDQSKFIHCLAIIRPLLFKCFVQNNGLRVRETSIALVNEWLTDIVRFCNFFACLHYPPF